MSANVLLEMTFICADHVALLRSLVREQIVAAPPPGKLAAHTAKLTTIPAEWFAVDFQHRTLKADWKDGSYVLVNRGDLVRVSTRNFPLDMVDLAARLARVDFEAATGAPIRYWDDRKGPAYTAPQGTVGTAPLGFGAAFKGRGHERAMSRRWLDRGPWRVLRGAGDTTFLQFHDERADVATSLEQARPCHALMSDRDQAPLPLRDAYPAGKVALGGIYRADERKLIVTVAGREVSRREMREAVATRTYQLLGEGKPVDNVCFRFADAAELDKALPDLWLYALEAELRDGAGVHRRDDGYTPPPLDKPAWVGKLGRDDRVS